MTKNEHFRIKLFKTINIIIFKQRKNRNFSFLSHFCLNLLMFYWR